MSVGAARAHTALYVVSLIVAVIIICVGGAFVGLQWSWSADKQYANADPAPPIVLLVWSVVTAIYFIVYFVIRHINSYNFFCSIIMDIVFLSVLAIIGIGVSSTMSVLERRGQWVKAAEKGYTGGIPTVGIVGLGLGWVQVALLLFIIIFEVYYTLKNYGSYAEFWQLSFLDLTDDGRPLDASRLRRRPVEVDPESRLVLAPTTVEPFPTPLPQVTPLPRPDDSLPPYEPPNTGLSPFVTRSSTASMSPVQQASVDYPLSAHPGRTAMPEWKRAVLESALPEWKREALAGPHLERELPPGAAPPARPSTAHPGPSLKR